MAGGGGGGGANFHAGKCPETAVDAGKLLRLRVYITGNYFYFNLNISKFELQYEWTPPYIYFCGYRVFQLM